MSIKDKIERARADQLTHQRNASDLRQRRVALIEAAAAKVRQTLERIGRTLPGDISTRVTKVDYLADSEKDDLDIILIHT